MCELLGLTSNRKVRMNELLETFYARSMEHRNGWGLAVLDAEPMVLAREPSIAMESAYLRELLKQEIMTSRCIAHIRKATIGSENVKNTHPFVKQDASGRRWVLVHNGTIFDSLLLAPLQYIQEGTTDSERILLYLVQRMDAYSRKEASPANAEARIHIVEEVLRDITPGNKVNLLLFDGEFLYVHTNERETLYRKEKDGTVWFATKPLSLDGWEEAPQNRLLVYHDGQLLYTGLPHANTYVHDERRMRLLYLAYSGL